MKKIGTVVGASLIIVLATLLFILDVARNLVSQVAEQYHQYDYKPELK